MSLDISKHKFQYENNPFGTFTDVIALAKHFGIIKNGQMNQSEISAHILKLEQRNHKSKLKAAFDKSERERFQDKINQLSSIHNMWSSALIAAAFGGDL